MLLPVTQSAEEFGKTVPVSVQVAITPARGRLPTARGQGSPLEAHSSSTRAEQTRQPLDTGLRFAMILDQNGGPVSVMLSS